MDTRNGFLHLVEAGETLGKIAEFYERDLDLLVRLNSLRNPNTIYVGEYLYIPPDNSDSIIRSGRASLQSIANLRHEYSVREGRMRALVQPAASAPRAPAAQPQARVPATAHKQPLSDQKVVLTQRPNEPRRSPNPPASAPPASSEPTPARAPMDFVWPLQGEYLQGFSTSGSWKFNLGVDIGARAGTPIRAAESGTVIRAGSFSEFPTLGNMVVVDHGRGFSTIYAHCSDVLVREGARVRKNEVIARAGSTGKAASSRLHLQLRYNGRAIDPERYFPRFPGRRP